MGPSDQDAVEKDYQGLGWEYPRAPGVRWLWDERATGAVLEFLGDTRVGCRTSTRANLGPQEREGEPEGEAKS